MPDVGRNIRASGRVAKKVVLAAPMRQPDLDEIMIYDVQAGADSLSAMVAIGYRLADGRFYAALPAEAVSTPSDPSKTLDQLMEDLGLVAESLFRSKMEEHRSGAGEIRRKRSRGEVLPRHVPSWAAGRPS